MTRKGKGRFSRGAESLSFTLSRWYRKMRSIKPSNMIIAAIVVIYAIFLFSGGLYTLINKPLPAAYYSGKFYFLYPYLSQQFVSDTIISFTLYAFGFVGLIAIYQSTRHAYNPRQAYMLLIIGVMLVLVSYIALEGSIYTKLHPSSS